MNVTVNKLSDNAVNTRTLVAEQFIQAMVMNRPAIENGSAYEQWRKDAKMLGNLLGDNTFEVVCATTAQDGVNRRV